MLFVWNVGLIFLEKINLIRQWAVWKLMTSIQWIGSKLKSQNSNDSKHNQHNNLFLLVSIGTNILTDIWKTSNIISVG